MFFATLQPLMKGCLVIDEFPRFVLPVHDNLAPPLKTKNAADGMCGWERVDRHGDFKRAFENIWDGDFVFPDEVSDNGIGPGMLLLAVGLDRGGAVGHLPPGRARVEEGARFREELVPRFG